MLIMIINTPLFSVRLLLLALLLTGLLFTHSVSAQAGIGLSPAFIEEAMEPGESKQLGIEISNLSNEEQTYYLSRRDITGVRPGGAPIFSDENSERSGFELIEWITMDIEELTIPAGGQENISFFLNVPDNASPGSHFGGIFVSVDPPRLRENGASVGYQVANIISVRVAGDIVELAQIRQFSTDKYLYGSTNIEFLVSIKNEGNVVVKPTGPLEINNMFGKRVALMIFNESISQVIPGETREFKISWEDQSPGFGRYEAILSPVYGEEGRKSTISSTVTFWILPMNIIGPAAVVLFIVLISIYVAVRLYVKRKVAVMSAGSTRRLVRSRKRGEFPILLVFVSMLTVTALFLIILLLLFS
jgi:hypothetical protein